MEPSNTCMYISSVPVPEWTMISMSRVSDRTEQCYRPIKTILSNTSRWVCTIWRVMTRSSSHIVGIHAAISNVCMAGKMEGVINSEGWDNLKNGSAKSFLAHNNVTNNFHEPKIFAHHLYRTSKHIACKSLSHSALEFCKAKICDGFHRGKNSIW